MVMITKRSRFTGIEHTLDIPVTQEQLNLWQSGNKLIQDAMPNLSASEREFLMSGATQQEWDDAFKEDNNEEN